MVNESKKGDQRYWKKWRDSGAVGNINGRYIEGKAYAIIGLEASKEQIEEELPRARMAAETPSELEISVREVSDLMNDKSTDPKLVRCIGQNFVYPIKPGKYLGPIQVKTEIKPMSKVNYVLEAKYPNADNGQAASEITDVTNYLYYAFGNDKPFCAEITAKAPNGQYLAWTND